MLSWSESAWFSMLLGMAFKSTVILAVAGLSVVLLRGRSAAARHLVWTAAAAAILVLPLLSVSLPRLPVTTPVAAGDPGLVFRVFSIATSDAPSVAVTPAQSLTLPAAPASRRADWKLWFVVIWAAGTFVSLLQMAAAYVALLRLRRRLTLLPADGQTIALAQSLEIDHDVDIYEGRAGTMPMTFGFLRPSILLPAEPDWSEERRRVVLLHELAHVRRGDTVTHVLARIALSLHWWNPLAWYAWRGFVQERERATDDLVLTVGTRASEYASHLLEVARAMQSRPVTACAAVAMARRSQLEGRLLAILDNRARGNTPRAWAPAAAAIAAVVLVAPFAAMRAQSQAEQSAPEIDATIRAANAQKNHEILEHAAAAYENLRQYDVAQRLLTSALDIRGQVSGQQSAAYAAGLVKLGDLEAKRNRRKDAIDFYNRAIALGDQPDVAPALVYLGMEAYGKRDYAQALDLLQRAVNVDPKGPKAGPALTWMAVVEQAKEQAKAAGDVSNTAVATAESLVERFRAITQLNQATGNYEKPAPPPPSPEAESFYQRALAAESADSLDTAITLELYSRYLRQQGRDSDAAPLSGRAAEIRRAHYPTDAQSTGGLNTAYKVADGVSAPVVLYKSDPEYTESARAAKYQGTVLLSVEIGPDGLTHNIRVVRSLGLGLDEKAIEAVQFWKFKPGMKDGQAVTVAATIEVNFRLL